MKRNDFINKCAACGFLSFMAYPLPGKQLGKPDVIINTNNPEHDINREQMVRVISFVDKDMDESVKQQFFTKLGQECFHCTNAEKWIKSMNLNGLLEFINNGKSSRWERIEYNADKSILKVIGRQAPCNCAFAQVNQPPKSLCNYCCKGFMKEFFGTLFEKKVYVTIDESVILGGERCSSTITIN